ncbi:MAG: DUF2513 domain-containing protein [Bacillota bacterium]
MERNMDLIRDILFEIEKQYVDVALINLKVKDYDFKEVAYHCKILYDAGLVSHYKGQYGSNELYLFSVGSLTWEGHEFLDKIKSDTVWKQTKETIVKKGLPWALDVVKSVVSAIVEGMVKGAFNQ